MIINKKVALVTGAAVRIGASIAQHLHAFDVNVIVHYHQSATQAQLLVAELNQRRADSARLLPANLTDFAHMPEWMQQAAAFWGQLDIVVNNAACFYPTPVDSVADHQWNALLDCNVKAPFFVSQAALPYLRHQQGCIVNIIDVHAERPLQDYAVYSISKAALAMMTQSLAKELGPSVRVNGVAPGAVLWPVGENQLTTAEQQRLVAKTALKRAGSPEDIAKAVKFLALDAPYVTGQILAVDGGRSLRM